MFRKDFAGYVSEGDTITCEVNGFDCTATLYRDTDSGPPDKMCDGYWPSLDPKDAGYIGPKSKAALARETKRARDVLDAWNRDEWHYFGVAVTIAIEGVQLTDTYAHALWGIEGNFPRRRKGNSNRYFRQVANDLLDEALGDARATLAKVLAKHGPATV